MRAICIGYPFNFWLSPTIMRLLLFDIDGTLVWTRGAGRAAMQDALVSLFEADITLRERLKTRVEKHVFGGKTDWLTLTELLADDGFSHDDIMHIMPVFTRAMGASMETAVQAYDVQPCPSALEVIAGLRSRSDIRLGLVTGNVSSSAPFKLVAAGFDPHDFGIGAYGDDALHRDDLPLIAMRRASQHFRHEFTADDTIIIGDTLADIQCARACGMRVAAVCTGFGGRDELSAAQPDWLIDDLSGFIDSVLFEI